jgi:hypothetical protein
MSVIIVVKLNTEKMLEHVLVRSSIEGGAHAIDPNDRRAAENALVHAMAMNVIWASRRVGRKP